MIPFSIQIVANVNDHRENGLLQRYMMVDIKEENEVDQHTDACDGREHGMDG